MQVGFYTGLARDFEFDTYSRYTLAHAALGKLFPIPVVITTSVESGPNGPIPDEIRAMYPNHTVIARDGEINAWDSPAFRAAVEATGWTQMVMAGISTDFCKYFLRIPTTFYVHVLIRSQQAPRFLHSPNATQAAASGLTSKHPAPLAKSSGRRLMVAWPLQACI